MPDLLTPTTLKFRVLGTPKPGGSKTAFYNPKLGRAMIVDACKGNKAWRDSVASAAHEAMEGRELFTGPLKLTVIFFRQRPGGHFGTGRGAGVVKSSAPEYPITKPDTTKLLRSTEDAMRGIIFRDDSQVVIQSAEKRFCAGNEPEGASIEIEQL